MTLTPLQEVQTAAGAGFAADGAERPQSFGDVAGEVSATRAAAGVFDLAGSAVFQVSGPDAADYLHRMVTISVKTLPAGRAARATVLKGDGRMIADVTVCRISSDRFLLLAPPVCRAPLFAHLDKYLITEQAEISDLSDTRAVFQVDGPKAGQVLDSAVGSPVAGLEPLQLVTAIVQAEEVFVIRTDTWALPGFAVIAPGTVAPALWKALADQAASLGGKAAGERARTILRIEAGVPEFGIDMDDSTIPLEANLREAIDFRKGCFPGQEIVARIENLGHPARMLVGLRFDAGSSPVTGTALFSGDKNVGRVTSVTDSPTLGQKVGLGSVKWDQREAGTALVLNSPDSLEQVTVAALPLVG